MSVCLCFWQRIGMIHKQFTCWLTLIISYNIILPPDHPITRSAAYTIYFVLQSIPLHIEHSVATTSYNMQYLYVLLLFVAIVNCGNYYYFFINALQIDPMWIELNEWIEFNEILNWN